MSLPRPTNWLSPAVITAILPAIAGLVPGYAVLLPGLFVLVGCTLLDAVFLACASIRSYVSSPNPKAERFLQWLFVGLYLLFFTKFVLETRAPVSATYGQLLCAALSWSILGGIPGLIVGHALIHSRVKIDRVLGKVFFTSVGYSEFPELHLKVHHRYLGTDNDLHAAPRGFNFYRFLLRGLAREGRSLPTVSQKVTMGHLINFSLILVVSLIAGWGPACIYVTVGFSIRTLIWLVNYIQHYGLTHALTQHSWDIDYRSANLIFFNAGFHSDHHERPSVSSSQLVKRSRLVLPCNFPIIMASALIPSLFFRLVDPLLEQEGIYENT